MEKESPKKEKNTNSRPKFFESILDTRARIYPTVRQIEKGGWF
jgi:hypothetical protein